MKKELLENEAFCVGVTFGLNLYQQRVIESHRRREPLVINEDLFYLESGRERLERALRDICQ